MLIAYEPDGEGGQAPVLIRELEVRYLRLACVEPAQLRIGTYVINPATGDRERTVVIVFDNDSLIQLSPGECAVLLAAAPFDDAAVMADVQTNLSAYYAAEAAVLYRVAQRISSGYGPA